jgi:hypothetical protein
MRIIVVARYAAENRTSFVRHCLSRARKPLSALYVTLDQVSEGVKDIYRNPRVYMAGSKY